MRYKPTIGLEIHIEPRTKSKMFCGCLNDSSETRPNKNVCPICLGHPGAMPVANIEAIKSVIRLGLALKGNIAERAIFDRKSYFYPDLPKGYQISQYEHPFVSGGALLGVRIRRIHLEEDAGKLIHGDGGKTLVDFNRGGVPLMELVTEPDIESGESAVLFAKELQLILRYLGISNADMEKGEMRLEANISVRPEDREEFGTKVEVKNLNSFKSLNDAINYELRRQEEAILGGEKIIQETRGWDAVAGETFSQRSKEEAQDYRYLPEPDLPLVNVSSGDLINLEELRISIPELPDEKRKRFSEEYGLNEIQAGSIIEDRALAEYFEETASEILAETGGETMTKALLSAANYILTDLRAILNEKGLSLRDGGVTPENMADLSVLIASGELSSRMAKDVLSEMADTGADPRLIINKRGMKQVFDEGAVREVVLEVISANEKVAADYKSGKMNALQFLLGQTMAKMKGQGNPAVIRKVLEEELAK